MFNLFSWISNSFPRISNSFPRIGQLILSDCNLFPRIWQSVLSDCNLFPRIRQSILSSCKCSLELHIAIREYGLSNSREGMAIWENELSNSRERIINPWERIAQFDITIYLRLFFLKIPMSLQGFRSHLLFHGKRMIALLTFKNLFQNYKVNLNQTLHNAFFQEDDISLFKWRAKSIFEGEIIGRIQ